MEEGKRRPVGIDLGKREHTMAIIGKKAGVECLSPKTPNVLLHLTTLHIEVAQACLFFRHLPL